MEDKLIKVNKCLKCGSPMFFSFVLPYKEFVCVPCGTGEEFCNSCEKIEISEKEYQNLKEKYKKDLQRVGYNTCKNGGGKCKHCGTQFNCDVCQEIEKYEFKYWGKG